MKSDFCYWKTSKKGKKLWVKVQTFFSPNFLEFFLESIRLLIIKSVILTQHLGFKGKLSELSSFLNQKILLSSKYRQLKVIDVAAYEWKSIMIFA